MQKYKPIVLLILDGWGLSPSWGGNALMMNNPQVIGRLWRNYPHKILQALGAIEYGNVVGESRLGHLMIGAGRNVSSNHNLINQEIKSRQFFKNKTLLEAFSWAKKNNSNVHLVGMISNGGVHSDIDHLINLLEFANRLDFPDVYIDAITDGVDTESTSALNFIERIERKLKDIRLGSIATIAGRAYAMDRDEHWDKTRKYFECLSLGKGEIFSKAGQLISQNYRQGLSDELIRPGLIKQKNGKIVTISPNDAIIFFNFREDRIKQLATIFLKPSFRNFLWRPKVPKNLYVATFINYSKTLPAKIVFNSPIYKNTLSEVLANLGFKQLKVAESEKFSHVTSFINGGNEAPFKGEDRKIVSSPEVASYNLRPEMSTPEITKIVKRAIRSAAYDLIIINLANVDMVAHTGDILAEGEAVKSVDKAVGEIASENLKIGGATIITADHGNAEQMIKMGSGKAKDVTHTLNPVPCIIVTKDNKKNLFEATVDGQLNALADIIQANDTLADIAPTILELMNIPKPKEMTGRSLLGRFE